MKDIIVEVTQDEFNDFFIRIPESVLVDLQWYDKTRLSLEIQGDGSIMLTQLPEKEEKSSEKEILL